MRILLVLLCLFHVLSVTASAIQLEDGRIVTGSLAIFSPDGAKIINHGATPDEFYNWAEISAIGLGPHEQKLRNEYIQTISQRQKRSPPSSTPQENSVNLSEIFSQPDGQDKTPTATGSSNTRNAESVKPVRQTPPAANAASSGQSPVTLDSLKSKLSSLTQLSFFTSDQNFGKLIAGAYLLITLIAFAANFSMKKRTSWVKNPVLIKKAINAAFLGTVIMTTASCAVLVYFPEKVGAEPLPLWLAASIAGGVFVFAMGGRMRSRLCAFLLLAAATTGIAYDLYGTMMPEIDVVTGVRILLSCVLTFALIDAFFATVHHHRAKKKVLAEQEPLPPADLADAAA